MQVQATAAAMALDNQERLRAALELRGKGRLSDALDLLSNPSEQSQDAFTLRGDLQLELGRVHEALGSYSTVIVLDNRNLYAHQKLAICLRRLGRWDAAVETLRNILRQDSYCDAARLGLGESLLHLKRPEEALASFEGCWSESALLPALFGKAVALQLLCRFDQAEKMYKSFLDLKPDSEEALNNLISLSMERSLFAQAQRYAMRLIGLRPQSPIALQALLVAAFERHELESAADYYRQLLDIPTNERTAATRGAGGIQYRLSPDDAARLTNMHSSRTASGGR